MIRRRGRYGTLYPAVIDGEGWRLVTGPFLHYSFAHYLVNVVLLVLVGWMTWPILGWFSVSVFVFGNILGAAGQLLWGGTLYDNVAGISAGVYALFGLLAGAAAIDKKLYPKGFGIVYGSVAVMAIAYSEVVSGDAATVAHLVGLGSGLLIGAIRTSIRRIFATKNR